MGEPKKLAGEYRFSPNDPMTKQIIVRAVAIKERASEEITSKAATCSQKAEGGKTNET